MLASKLKEIDSDRKLAPTTLSHGERVSKNADAFTSLNFKHSRNHLRISNSHNFPWKVAQDTEIEAASSNAKDITEVNSSLIKKRSLYEQVRDATINTFKVIIPAWLVVWLGAAATDSVINMVGIDNAEIPVTRPISNNLLTSQYSTLNIDLSKLSSSEKWNSLAPTRELLEMHSPDMARWLNNLQDSGKLSIQAKPFAGESRYSDYRIWNRTLTLYPEFFSLSEGEKVIVLRHEAAHAGETIPGYIANSIQPQILIGAVGRFGASISSSALQVVSNAGHKLFGPNNTTYRLSSLADSVDTWANDSGWPRSWRYIANASERKAVEAERQTMKDLGLANSASAQGLSTEFLGENPQIKNQEIYGTIALSAIAFSSLLRRRRKAEVKSEIAQEIQIPLRDPITNAEAA